MRPFAGVVVAIEAAALHLREGGLEIASTAAMPLLAGY